jgi:flagellar hook-associated protein 1 FlgK
LNIGGKVIVWGATSTDLEIDTDETDPLNISDVVWSDTGKEVRITTGQMYGILESRDTVLPKYIEKLDTLVAGLITEVNAVHSQGWGLNGYSKMTSSYAVADASAALGSAGSGLNFHGQLQAGTMNINAIDSSGGVHTFGIAITSDTTLNGAVPDNNLVNLINSNAGNAGYVTASVDASGRLVLTAAGGYTFTVTDSSASSSRIGVALGLNNYFTGTDASNIAVNPLFGDEPDKVAGASSYSSGDNTNAMAIAALRDSHVMLGNTVTIEGYYQTEIVGALGVELDQANSMVDNQDLIVSQINNSMDEVSGVSLDEEMASLVQFQHAYGAAAKYMILVQSMLQSLIDII